MLVNLTPHAITVFMPQGGQCAYVPTGDIARCVEETSPAGEVDGIPIVYRSYGAVTGLPEPSAGYMYIVSQLVRMACPERHDLVSPGDMVRDADGRILGCRNFVVSRKP